LYLQLSSSLQYKMERYKQALSRNRRIIMSVVLALFSTLFLQAGRIDSLKWVQVRSPVNSDIKVITFPTPEYGVAIAKQLLTLKNGQWIKYPHQPPVSIDKAYFPDSHTFFIAHSTKYQESELYYGNGKTWNRIRHPLANAIFAMYFSDSVNGVIAGSGEIAVLKNGQWKLLPPPGNDFIGSVITDKDSVIWALTSVKGLFRYDKKWVRIKNTGKARSIQLVKNKVYVLGYDYLGVVGSNDSVSVISTHQELKKATSFFVLNKNDITAVGNDGLILRYKNSRWKQEKSGVTEDLTAVWMLNEHEGWISGDNGLILHYTIEQVQPVQKTWRGFEKSYLYNANTKVTDDEYGVVAADFDGDGLTDIFICGLFEADHLYINMGKNNFVNKAQQWKVSGIKSIDFRELNLGACAGDLDNDGDNDLYVTVLNGSNNLYKNIRGHYFVSYSSVSGGTGKNSDRTNAVILGDVDNDGDLDIFITNEYSTNRLYLNNGAGIFTEVTQLSGLTTEFGGMGCSFGDIDSDGDLDLYVANWSAKNILYRNLLKETGHLVFENITDTAGVGGKIYTKSNAVVFSDIDNDADLDLLVTNRKTSNKLYLNNGKGIFTDVTVKMIGEDSLKSYGAVIADFDGDGFKDIYISNVGENVFYKNINGKRFADQTLKYEAEIDGYSTGTAVGDFDNGGSPDIYIASYIGESSAILLNSMNNKQQVTVVVKGIKNNRSGIGARVYVYREDTSNRQGKLLSFTEISGGSGYASMNQRFLPIPVPGQDFVDVKVVFPMGEVKTVRHVKAGSRIVVEDKTGFDKTLTLSVRYLLILIKDPHQLLHVLAWIFVLAVILFSMISGTKRYGWPLLYSILFSLLLISLYYFQSGYFEYKNLLLSTFLPVLSVLTFITLLLLYFERTKIKALALAEQELTQKKLSRDLHDDLGSTVSTIAIYLTLIRYNLGNREKLNQLLDKTSELVNDTATVITDMVWAVNPKSESLDNLILRVKKNFVTPFREIGARFSVRAETDMEKIMLNYKVKHNIYLITKEALNNALKYADAQEVEVVVNKQGPEIHLSIKDDGKGFDLSVLKNKGHGITNMRSRTGEMKGRFNINSTPRKGTEINIFFKPE